MSSVDRMNFASDHLSSGTSRLSADSQWLQWRVIQQNNAGCSGPSGITEATPLSCLTWDRQFAERGASW
jgi:hypothetical protein